ncbi:MAG: NUDIX domain-containing protein [Chloroflexi bacterium]|nr:NUDIX domain-containing protein [Chloroflexota bacterium]
MKIRQEIPIKSFSICAYLWRTAAGGPQVLVLLRTSKNLNNTWQMVSGRLEKDETGWQAALREIEEETGLKPDRFYSTDKVECFYAPDQNCISVVPVFIGFVDTPQEVRLSDEHSDYRWISPEEAEAYLSFDQQVEMVQYLRERFVDREPKPLLRIPVP